MKTSLKLAFFLLLLVAFFVRARYVSPSAEKSSRRQVAVEIPADVKALVDNKCYGCHSDKGRSQEAKDDLMWDSIPHYDKAKQVAVLDDIVDVLDKGKMPPEKMIEMHPEAKLKPEEVKFLKAWAESTADQIMK
jgi:hypothetical protein